MNAPYRQHTTFKQRIRERDGDNTRASRMAALFTGEGA